MMGLRKFWRMTKMQSLFVRARFFSRLRAARKEIQLFGIEMFCVTPTLSTMTIEEAGASWHSGASSLIL